MFTFIKNILSKIINWFYPDKTTYYYALPRLEENYALTSLEENERHEYEGKLNDFVSAQVKKSKNTYIEGKILHFHGFFCDSKIFYESLNSTDLLTVSLLGLAADMRQISYSRLDNSFFGKLKFMIFGEMNTYKEDFDRVFDHELLPRTGFKKQRNEQINNILQELPKDLTNLICDYDTNRLLTPPLF